MRKVKHYKQQSPGLSTTQASSATHAVYAARPRALGPRTQAASPRTRAALALAALLTLLAITPLAGCRYSETLTEIIIDPVNGRPEPRATALWLEKDEAPEDPTKASVRLAENENLAQQENFLPVYKQDAPVNGMAIRRVHEEFTPDANDAAEGNLRGEDPNQNTQTAEEDPTETTADASGEGESADQTQASEDGQGTQSNKTSGRGGTGKVYGDGSYEDLPDGAAIAAKGHYALITQMLAGKGGLAAADATFLQQANEKGIFPGEGLDALPAVWDAQGSLNLDALIASEADVLIIDNEDSTVTPEQRDRLLAEGINVVTAPPLGNTYTPDADIVAAVKVVGQVLSGLKSRATYDTAEMVQRYIQLHDTALEGVLNANGGYSYKMVNGFAYQGIYQGTAPSGESTTRLSQNRVNTVCVDSWSPARATSSKAHREFYGKPKYLHGHTADTSDGVALSTTTLGGNFVTTDYYLQIAGVCNNAYDTAKPTTSSNRSEANSTLPYLLIPGSDTGIASQNMGIRQAPSAFWFSETGTSISDAWLTAGDPTFPGVIVRDQSQASSMAASAAKTNGLYNVGQPYKIYQMPKGIAGSWYDGNTESFLSALWAYGVLRGDPATPMDARTSSAKEWINGFYRLFYRLPENSASAYVEGIDSVTEAVCPRDPAFEPRMGEN